MRGQFRGEFLSLSLSLFVFFGARTYSLGISLSARAFAFLSLELAPTPLSPALFFCLLHSPTPCGFSSFFEVEYTNNWYDKAENENHHKISRLLKAA